jgi:cell division protein ZapA
MEAMGQVTVNVNGRSYRFDCGDGEEARLNELAAYVKGRIDALVKEFGKVGDERLLLTAALLITDELMDARASLVAAGANAQSASATAAKLNEEKAGKPEDVLRKAVGAEV